MKKILFCTVIIAILICQLMLLSSCDGFANRLADNAQNTVTSMKHDYALINAPDGTSIKVELKSWGSDGATPTAKYYIFGTDGTGYIVGVRNCTFINDPNVNIDVTSFSGLTNMNYSYTEAMIKLSDGEIITLNDFEDVNAASNVILLEDEDGVIYTPHPDNVLIKLKNNNN